MAGHAKRKYIDLGPLQSCRLANLYGDEAAEQETLDHSRSGLPELAELSRLARLQAEVASTCADIQASISRIDEEFKRAINTPAVTGVGQHRFPKSYVSSPSPLRTPLRTPLLSSLPHIHTRSPFTSTSMSTPISTSKATSSMSSLSYSSSSSSSWLQDQKEGVMRDTEEAEEDAKEGVIRVEKEKERKEGEKMQSERKEGEPLSSIPSRRTFTTYTYIKPVIPPTRNVRQLFGSSSSSASSSSSSTFAPSSFSFSSSISSASLLPSTPSSRASTSFLPSSTSTPSNPSTPSTPRTSFPSTPSTPLSSLPATPATPNSSLPSTPSTPLSLAAFPAPSSALLFDSTPVLSISSSNSNANFNLHSPSHPTISTVLSPSGFPPTPSPMSFISPLASLPTPVSRRDRPFAFRRSFSSSLSPVPSSPSSSPSTSSVSSSSSFFVPGTPSPSSSSSSPSSPVVITTSPPTPVILSTPPSSLPATTPPPSSNSSSSSPSIPFTWTPSSTSSSSCSSLTQTSTFHPSTPLSSSSTSSLSTSHLHTPLHTSTPSTTSTPYTPFPSAKGRPSSSFSSTTFASTSSASFSPSTSYSTPARLSLSHLSHPFTPLSSSSSHLTTSSSTSSARKHLSFPSTPSSSASFSSSSSPASSSFSSTSFSSFSPSSLLSLPVADHTYVLALIYKQCKQQISYHLDSFHAVRDEVLSTCVPRPSDENRALIDRAEGNAASLRQCSQTLVDFEAFLHPPVVSSLSRRYRAPKPQSYVSLSSDLHFPRQDLSSPNPSSSTSPYLLASHPLVHSSQEVELSAFYNPHLSRLSIFIENLSSAPLKIEEGMVVWSVIPSEEEVTRRLREKEGRKRQREYQWKEVGAEEGGEEEGESPKRSRLSWFSWCRRNAMQPAGQEEGMHKATSLDASVLCDVNTKIVHADHDLEGRPNHVTAPSFLCLSLPVPLPETVTPQDAKIRIHLVFKIERGQSPSDEGRATLPPTKKRVSRLSRILGWLFGKVDAPTNESIKGEVAGCVPKR